MILRTEFPLKPKEIHTSSIDPARFLQEQLASASPDLLRALLTTFINTLMSAATDAICGAPYGESSPERTNVRNGYRHRELDTRAGTLDVAIPEAARGQLLPGLAAGTTPPRRAGVDHGGGDLLSARRQHSADGEAGRVPRDHRLSKSQVSVMAKELDEQVEAFRTRPLDQGPYTFVAADALVLKSARAAWS